MIGVLVRNQDSVHALGAGAAKDFKASHHFLAAKARVDEQSGVLGFEQC
jgi:hypothetical protein